MEKKLSVQDLKISFRTSNGKVQAVRDISFDLYKGETLAIVGESGSGKSVTSRAIMGILAGNAIVEGGKILYGDKDLLKITEEEFHKIRGDKIAMVFQDPLSSLNPIMRVGNQLTEAMLLKNKASRKESKERMNDLFAALETNMEKAFGSSNKEDIEKFKKFELKHCALESEYTESITFAQEALALSEHVCLKVENKQCDDLDADIMQIIHAANGSCTYFVVREREAELKEITASLKSAARDGKKLGDYYNFTEKLKKLIEILKEAIAYEAPNTFTLGYYLTFEGKEIPKMSVAELNKLTHQKTTDDFMAAFMTKAEKAVAYSAEVTDKARENAIKVLNSKLPVFEGELEKGKVEAAVKDMKEAVSKCLDMLDTVKDSLTHTFASSMDYAVNLYFDGLEKNAREEKRYAAHKAKHDKIIAKGKTPNWEVIPASFVNTEGARTELISTAKQMAEHFEQQIAANKKADYAAKSLAIVDSLKENAANSVYKVTRSAAREKAIKLMESVGIDNPRRRYSQYPFEFSGGMRQRIVIAIALTANPDILICDEPTTALDVTIQAQILELINNLKKERNLSVIFITHDLGVVANMADRIAVMYAGKIVEHGTADDVFYSPAHPYTWALLSSVPDLDTKEKLESIPGTPPNMIYPPKGDAFADRNKYALEIDFEEQPPMFKISDTHYAATWLLHPDAPKIEIPKIIVERIERMRNARKEGK